MRPQPSTLRPLFQYPNACTYLFNSPEGYGEGRIHSISPEFKIQWINHVQKLVKLNTIHQISPQNQIYPKRQHSQEVYIQCPSSDSQIQASGYISCGSFTEPSQGVSGAAGNLMLESKLPCLPIRRPLTLHNEQHQKLLIETNQLIQAYVLDFLACKSSSISLDEITWKLNVILYIDGYLTLPKKVIQEALALFITDFLQYPLQTWIRSPLNYILDPLQIDGLVYQDWGISFLPSYASEFNYSR